MRIEAGGGADKGAALGKQAVWYSKSGGGVGWQSMAPRMLQRCHFNTAMSEEEDADSKESGVDRLT
jgi:hypothetical protein